MSSLWMHAIFYFDVLGQFDRHTSHDGCLNTYKFDFNGVKIVLIPSRDHGVVAPSSSLSECHTKSPFLSSYFYPICYERRGYFFVLLIKPIVVSSDYSFEIHPQIRPMIDEFLDVFPSDLPIG